MRGFIPAQMHLLHHDALARQPFANAVAFSVSTVPCFQNAGTDAAKHMGAAAAFQNDRIDAIELEDARHQKSRRSGANNPH